MNHSAIAIDANGVQPTLLGSKNATATRIATGGKIRGGIKVLTKKAAENPQARQIYDQGVTAGQSFEQIEKSLFEALPNLTTPLVPKNTPWFTVRAQDFPNPAIANQILEAYGEARGDGVKRLYRFPVIFPSDSWQTVMPHELVAWGANERKYWSEYSRDGRERFCKCHAPVPKVDSGNRAIRIFGGRKSMLRPDNGGLCEPESCYQYQQRQCNLSGRFIFFIPGIKSLSAFELPTASFYAMNAAIQKFETIAFMRGGRISGFLDAECTPFYLSKKLMDVPRIDEEGRAVRVKQWIIELEAPVDVTALLRANDDVEAAIVNAQAASRMLQVPHDAVVDQPTVEIEPTPMPVKEQRRDETTGKASSRKPATAPDAEPEVKAILEIAATFGFETADYETYAKRSWGSGWKLNAKGRQRALDELEHYRNDELGFRDRVLSKLEQGTRGGKS